MNNPDPSPRTLASARWRTILALVGGFVLGAIVFAPKSCGDSEHAEHSAADHRAPIVWTCSMDPQVRRSEPGRCPICGMELIPAAVPDGPASAPNGAPSVDGVNRVVLSDRARALAKLRTTTVRRQADVVAQLRLLGRFEPNETTLRTVTAWTGGRIDRLQVNVTGQRVRARQVIATLYSPEVFAAHQDLLVAKRQVDRMQSSPEASRRAAQAALEAARERLRLLGVPADQLAGMEKTARPTRAVAIRTPFSGTVIERLATEGAYVSTGTPLYRVADLRTLWVQLDAYESDLSRLSVGQPVTVSVDALPGEQFEGRVTFIDPTLDARRRTAKVRVQVANRDGRLRPGMFAEATVATHEASGEQRPLVVPATAPLFTGRRAIVYAEVRVGDAVAYEPRTVRLGPRLGDVYPVVAGLSEGDRVVTRGAFALDADLQIRGGPSMMTGADDREQASSGAIDLPPSAAVTLAPVVSAYLSVQVALADDDLPQSVKAAEALIRSVTQVKLSRPSDAVAAWAPIAEALRVHARHVVRAGDLEGARQGFEPLSEAVIRLLATFGNPLDGPVRLAHCPMAAGSEGAQWVQQGAEVDNSYFGASMLTCGEVRQEVAPGGFLERSSAGDQPP